jgi:cephalosporin-C deacetylase-like acetyl esterase
MRKNSIALFVLLFLCLGTLSPFPHPQEELTELKNRVIGDEAYQAILQFYQYDRDVPLDPVVISRSETDDYMLEKIAFKGTNEFLVPGYFAVPKNGTPPYPCILQLHGMTLSKEVWWERDGWHRGPPLSPKLLADGFAVLSIDYPLHGERSILNEFENTYRMLFRQKRIYKFRDMVINAVIDSRRALDYLESRKEIDSSRFGVLGSSIGGTMSLILTGVDSRITVTTALVSPTLIRSIYDGQPDISAILPYNFARAFNKRPLLMLMGKNDTSQYTVDGAKALFDLVEGDSKEITFYDCGHRLPEEHVPKVIDWFKEHLK